MRNSLRVVPVMLLTMLGTSSVQSQSLDLLPGIRLNSTERRGIDIDGNGFEEFLIQIPAYDEQDPRIGEVKLLATDDPWNPIVLASGEANDGFGMSATIIGDVTGDGVLDIAVGSPFAKMQGDVYGRIDVYCGSSAALVYSVSGFDEDGLFGYSLAGISDIDSDGIADLIVGAPHAGINHEGRVFVLSGVDGFLLSSFEGEESADLFGFAVAAAGDFNGDGIEDILIGAPQNDLGGSDAGRAYLYAGSTEDIIATITGEGDGDRLGSSLAGAVDLNGDGLSDVVVGAPGYHSGSLPCLGCKEHGRVYVVHAFAAGEGSDMPAGNADLVIAPSILSDYSFGLRVEIGNDVDQDGVSELVVIAAFEDGNGETKGRMYVHSGVDGSMLGTSVGDDNDPEKVGNPANPTNYVWDCPYEDSCPEACSCLEAALAHYNARIRSVNRKWWLVPICAIPCSAICCPPLTVPGFAACVACIGWVGNETILEALRAAEDLEHDFIDCFASVGCPIPPFPWW